MSFEKYRILLWKNWIIKKRHWKGGLFELIFPVILIVLFTWIKHEYFKDVEQGEVVNEEFLPSNSTTCQINYGPANKIVFSPASPWLESFVKSVFEKDKEGMEFEMFENAVALDNFLNANRTMSEEIFGIEFDDSMAGITEHPKVFKYTLRMPIDVDYFEFRIFHYCLGIIQNRLERAYLSTFDSLKVPEIYLGEFSYLASFLDTFSEILKVFLPILIVFSTFYSANNIIKNVAIERESQLKESMRIMGLSSSLHWTAWFTTSFIILLIAFSIVTIFLKFKIIQETALLEFSNIFLIWIFFIFYIVSVITFGFLISVIFKKATTAGNMGTILFLVTFIVFFQFRSKFESLNYVVKLLYCLPVNTGLGQGLSIILEMEREEVGLNFSNIATRQKYYEFSVAEVLMTFVIASVIHLLLMVYIEQVFTGNIGVPKPWYFPVASIVKKFKNKSSIDFHPDDTSKPVMKSGDFEKDPENIKAGVQIQNITKKFGNATVVNKLSLNMYEDQITVLLGHNGAGKTTTMNMLTGMFAPSSGTAFLNGFDITTETLQARNSLGLCPQHNILIDDLTVKEHIIFFCRLKGVKSSKEIEDEITKFADLLDFNDKIDALSKTLSGGQKRKLSIGVALCGHSKIVMLDEPTSGLDTGARRALWNLLIQEKKGRTILLTTHHMDEADVLGDRIAIMSEGQLQTVGSSFFLKKRFGSGYKLICVKEQGCKPDEILKVLKDFAPDVMLESNAQSEVVFVINEDNLPVFHQMFKKIEDESKRLKISSFGCSLTTLEEVFIKVGSDANKSNDEKPQQVHDFNDFTPTKRVKGLKLTLGYQVYAMILKHFHYTRRASLYSIGWLVLMSAVLTYIMLQAPFEFDSFEVGIFLPEDIKLSSYNQTTTILQQDGSHQGLYDVYKTLFDAPKDKILETQENFDEFIASRYRANQRLVDEEFLIAATFNADRITAWSQKSKPVLRALTLNMMHRAVLKEHAGSDFDIFVSNRKFNVSEDSERTTEPDDIVSNRIKRQIPEEGEKTKEEELSFGATIVNFLLMFMLLYVLLAYWPSIFIGLKVKERVTRSKLLQQISGANRFVYWLTSFAIDFLILLIISYLILGGIAIDQRAYFRTGEQLGTFMVVFACYAFATIPFLYAFSFIFDKHAAAEMMVKTTALIFGVMFIVWTLFGFLLGFPGSKVIADVIYWVGLLFGPFSLIDCFRKIGYGSQQEPKTNDDGEVEYPPSNAFNFEQYGIMNNLIMMICAGVLFMTFCLLKDYLVFDKLIYLLKKRSKFILTRQSTDIDEDVLNETKKIKNLTDSELQDGNLVLKNLTKFYNKNLAVNQLHLGVDNGECFGLLGINGAGKTSTFKMMTGDEIISDGDVWIRGNSMKNNMMKAQKSIGYCPQFDALIFDISGREALKIFSLIRGIPLDEIDGIILKLATELGFHMHLDKKAKAYSGGNKRKLSTALSLLGNPDLIFLDEPTTGIDPYSKRQLWTIINKTRNSGKSVILTSHSMEECEALCTRLAIMVAGEFKCLGSVQHLKNKFSQGFILTIKMQNDTSAQLYEIQNRVNQMFQPAVLKEKYMDLLTFHITSTHLKWSEVFSIMSQLKREIEISDFSITQMSLEQVFLYFTREGQVERLQEAISGEALI